MATIIQPGLISAPSLAPSTSLLCEVWDSVQGPVYHHNHKPDSPSIMETTHFNCNLDSGAAKPLVDTESKRQIRK